MFEKDAEEYVDLSGNRNYTERAFKDGAEFGYNKANEWHYVEDGDLPKESCIVYYKGKFGVPSWTVVHPTWYIPGVEAFFKNNPQIIAWCEIPLFQENTND